MSTYRITFVDGSVEEVDGERLRYDEQVLSISRRLTAYTEDVKAWPLANIKSWEEVHR